MGASDQLVQIDPATDEIVARMAVSRDGKFVFASQYDTKKVARIDTASNVVAYLALPSESQGPVQLYPTPDGSSEERRAAPQSESEAWIA